MGLNTALTDATCTTRTVTINQAEAIPPEATRRPHPVPRRVFLDNSPRAEIPTRVRRRVRPRESLGVKLPAVRALSMSASRSVRTLDTRRKSAVGFLGRRSTRTRPILPAGSSIGPLSLKNRVSVNVGVADFRILFVGYKPVLSYYSVPPRLR